MIERVGRSRLDVKYLGGLYYTDVAYWHRAIEKNNEHLISFCLMRDDLEMASLMRTTKQPTFLLQLVSSYVYMCGPNWFQVKVPRGTRRVNPLLLAMPCQVRAKWSKRMKNEKKEPRFVVPYAEKEFPPGREGERRRKKGRS